MPLLVIGPSASPRCFKGGKIPTEYKAQKKSWMTAAIFEQWVRRLDRTMTLKGRKIALLVDNCPSHCSIPGLNVMQLYFLPPNSTAAAQPMDAGILRSLKCRYRRRLVQRRVNAFDTNQQFGITLITAMQMLRYSWDAVEPAVIQHCFKKAFEPTGASSSVSEETIEQGLWEKVVGIERDGSVVPLQEYTDIDNDLITFEATNEQETIESLEEGDQLISSESDNQVVDITPGENELRVSYLEALKGLEKLRGFCIQEHFDYTQSTEWMCSSGNFTNSKMYLKRLKISDFFH